MVDNTLARRFDVAALDKAWVTDITYIRTQEGFAYLAVVIDLFSRRVIVWSMQSPQTTDAYCKRCSWPCGAQFTSMDWAAFLKPETGCWLPSISNGSKKSIPRASTKLGDIHIAVEGGTICLGVRDPDPSRSLSSASETQSEWNPLLIAGTRKYLLHPYKTELTVARFHCRQPAGFGFRRAVGFVEGKVPYLRPCSAEVTAPHC